VSSIESRVQTFQWLIRIRWICIAFITLLILVIEPKVPYQALNGIWIILFTAFAFNLIFHILSRFPRAVGPTLLFMFFMDGLLVSAGVALTGGPYSFYIPLFMLIIISACLVASPQQALWASLWQVALFLLTMFYCYQQKLVSVFDMEHPNSLSFLLEKMPPDLRRGIYWEQTARWLAFFILTLVICAILTRQVWSREEKLRLKERDLEQKRRLIQLGELSGRIAHGVNTPLGLISGNLEMLMAETKAKSKTYQKLQQIEKYVQRAIQTVRGVLDYSRQTMSQIQPVSLPQVMTAVVEAVQPKLKKVKGNLILDVDPQLPALKAHMEGIFQLLLNLVENAIDSISSGGMVTLSAHFQYHSMRLSAQDRRGKVKIVVRDTGQGIPPTELKQIFEPFYSTKNFGKGTGLGLSIVKRIVDEHHGELNVESHLGQGTSFTVILPTDRLKGEDSGNNGDFHYNESMSEGGPK
jgi:signal transduction histidine kinase